MKDAAGIDIKLGDKVVYDYSNSSDLWFKKG